MRKESELWNFVAERLSRSERVMLLVVAESRGSSPGRAGYKMAVAEDGRLVGSIGGGVMEVNLVEQAKGVLSESRESSKLLKQVHRKNSRNLSGMICSGEQTVIFRLLTAADAFHTYESGTMQLSHSEFSVRPSTVDDPKVAFSKLSETEFSYAERLGPKNRLFIIGGGHCALALSELMSKMDFYITIFDDRPELNTLEKNHFADTITIIESYESIAEHLPDDEDTYVVIMTLGYKTDAVVIRQLIDRDFKYFGVLGSKAKMATLMKELKSEGLDHDRLACIRTPIGIPINSHTPEEIAVSIAAEIISVKNS